MKKTFLQNNNASFFRPVRLVFDGMDKAPKANDNFQNPEKQTEAQAVNEVASQSPSQIFNDTISAGAAIKGQYSQGTTTLANLVNNDPMFTGNWSGATTTTTTTTGTAAGTTTGTTPTTNKK